MQPYMLVMKAMQLVKAACPPVTWTLSSAIEPPLLVSWLVPALCLYISNYSLQRLKSSF